MINLRPHHLICLRLFAGSGYSEAFAQNMCRVIAELKAQPESPFLLVEGPDDICTACPNLSAGGACALGSDVGRRDHAVLHALGLRAGANISHADVDALLRQRFVPEAFLACCGGCRWQEQGFCSHDALVRGLLAR